MFETLLSKPAIERQQFLYVVPAVHKVASMNQDIPVGQAFNSVVETMCIGNHYEAHSITTFLKYDRRSVPLLVRAIFLNGKLCQKKEGRRQANETRTRERTAEGCERGHSMWRSLRGSRRGGRHPDGEEREQGSCERTDHKYQRIPGFDAEQEAGDEAGIPEGCADADRDANDGEPHAVPDDEFADGGAVAAGRSRATRVSSHQRDVHRWTILFDFGHIRI